MKRSGVGVGSVDVMEDDKGDVCLVFVSNGCYFISFQLSLIFFYRRRNKISPFVSGSSKQVDKDSSNLKRRKRERKKEIWEG